MESIAWLLNFGDGQLAAVGKRELLHLVPQPELFEVPRTPRHCSRVLIWQHRVVPVWDILAWIKPGSRAKDAGLVAVVGYQSRRRQTPQFGAMVLAEPPSRIGVTDAQACELSREQSAWGEIAISCFRHEEKPVAVLDLPLMFSGAFAADAST
ncbi:MAG: hypothetical protein Q8O52_28170 [Sulfuritalea sp.]|nr:hypothetical protein [Sulfuritalea sp.]